MKLKRLSKIIIGEIEEYTKMMAEAREQAIDRMVADAINMGANGIVGIRFTTSTVLQGAAELVAYGTGVKLENRAREGLKSPRNGTVTKKANFRTSTRRAIMIKERELWVAYLLWFFLGLIGVHKFYVNKIGMGILYIFTGGIFLIGWLIDLFTLPSQVRKYNAEVRSMSGADQT
jgi:TM2 domain-containing membrane protein YozV